MATTASSAPSGPVTLTSQRIADIGLPADRIEVRDAKQPALRLRISPSGIRSWVWFKRVHGRPQRVTIGRFPEVDIAAARKAAAKLSAEAALGSDPAADRKVAKVKSATLQTAFDDYLAAKKLRPRTEEEYRSLFAKMAPLHNREVTAISRDDVERLHRKLSAQSKTRADGAMRVLRAVLNRAFDRIEDAGGGVYGNPVKRLSAQDLWNGSKRKTTRIASADLAKFVHAVRNDESPIAGDLVLTLLATGWRLGETRTLRWSDIDLDAAIVTLRAEETKSGREAVLPIPEQVMAILRKRRGMARRSAVYVFESRQRQPLRNAKALLARVAAETGITASHHDLRRTFASTADEVGTGTYTLKKLLTHAIDQRDVTAGYANPDFEKLREAQQKIADATVGEMP